MSAARLAVFDLDGTLLRRDSFLPFVFRFGWRHRRWRSLAGAPLWIGAYACGLMTAHDAKQRLLISFFRGSSREVLDQAAKDFCDDWVPRYLNDPVVQRLKEYQQHGDRVVLLSASPSIYVRAVASFLEIDDVVCTGVGFQEGVCTGQIEHENCKGAAKLAALQAFLQRSEAPHGSAAYGDSVHDLPVLQWVEEGFLVAGDQIRSVNSPRGKRSQLAHS